MKICENCLTNHDIIYGSGRFCSSKCARGFSTKNKRREINEKVSKSMSGKETWSKGKTKETNESIKKMSESLKGRTLSCETKSKISKSKQGQTLSTEIKNKISESNKGKTGGYRKGSGFGLSGWYKGYYCDSSWELAFVIYNLEHNIKFKRNVEKFQYEFENKTLYYLPDFILEDGTYIEIKGYETDQTKAKYLYFPHELKVISGKKQIKPYLTYVESKYGKDFVKLYE